MSNVSDGIGTTNSRQISRAALRGAATFFKVLTDGRRIPADTVLLADLCLIGAGPAGLAIAHELFDSKLTILIVERGEMTTLPAPIRTSTLDVESPHFHFPLGCIAHQFGGMAATWKPVFPDGAVGARYLPLDPIDFEARYWVPYSGWPLTFDELAPFYDRARQSCGLRAFDFHNPFPDAGRMPLSTPSGDLVTRLDQFGPAAIFTSERRAEIFRSEGVHLVTNATAVEVISADGSADGLAEVSVRNSAGRPFTVRSRAVVVAAGAIDTARLLLNSKKQHPTGLGNRFDNVGRFFMEHPRIVLAHGSFLRRSTLHLYEPHEIDGQLVEGRLKLDANVLRREELLNGTAYITPNDRFSTAQVRGARSGLLVLGRLKSRRATDQVARHIAAAARQAPALGLHYLRRGLRRPADWVLGSHVEPGSVARSFEVVYQPEQAPNRANRVTLSERRDVFGYPVARLHWRWSEIDLLSIRRAGQIFASELRASGAASFVREEGRLVPEGEGAPRLPTTAHHLLGTTRMHELPRHGVVDSACRIHGCSSVYLAGGSVFTTGGSANPTLTVVALAIRLADELKRTVAAR